MPTYQVKGHHNFLRHGNRERPEGWITLTSRERSGESHRELLFDERHTKVAGHREREGLKVGERYFGTLEEGTEPVAEVALERRVADVQRTEGATRRE